MNKKSKKKILITGGSGFVGKNLAKRLRERSYSNLTVVSSDDYNLLKQAEVKEMYEDINPEWVFHLAALVGGIYANMTMKGKFYYQNMLINTMTVEQARKAGVEKVFLMGSGCIYPREVEQPIKEDDLWDGYPESTNAPYAFSKRMLLVQSQAYREQYGFNSIFLLPGNLYGPYDNFHPEHSHVVPALIRKFIEAEESRNDQVVVWGDGTPTRDFHYIQDAVDGIIDAMEKFDSSKPVNIGSGEETSIEELVGILKELTGFEGEIIWDESKPNGQPRRVFDITRAKKAFDYQPTVSLREGLDKTIKWFKNNRNNIRYDEK